MVANAPEPENDLISRAVEWLQAAVPSRWKVEVNSRAYYGNPNLPEPQRLDRAIDITTDQRIRGTLIVESKRTFTPRDVGVFSEPLARQLRTAVAPRDRDRATGHEPPPPTRATRYTAGCTSSASRQPVTRPTGELGRRPVR
jgi:hypothetical protein